MKARRRTFARASIHLSGDYTTPRRGLSGREGGPSSAHGPRRVASITAPLCLALFTHLGVELGWSDAPSKYSSALHAIVRPSVRPSVRRSPFLASTFSPSRQKSTLLAARLFVAPFLLRELLAGGRALELYFTALRSPNNRKRESRTRVWNSGSAH